MAHFSRSRAIAAGLILILSGSTSASTAADVPFAGQFLLSSPDATDVPILVALADPLAPRFEPAAFESMEAVVAPLVAHEDRMALGKLPGKAETHGPAPSLRNQGPASAAFGPARFFTINQVLAKRSRGTSAPLELAAIDPGKTATDAATLLEAHSSVEPFGLFTFKAPEGQLWAKWRKARADMQAEASVLAKCRAEPEHCMPAAARFNTIVAEATAAQGRARLTLVNERVNAAIRYASDYEQYGVADLWSAPLASLDSGRGDCEDYAIAKYALLRQAGVADSDLHVLLVRDNAVHLDHAVLAVRDDGHWLILDNRWNRLTEDSELYQFAPLFALDEEGVKLFAAPYAAVDAQNPFVPKNGNIFIAGAQVGDLAVEKDRQPPQAAGAWTPLPLLL
jgi:predicted transglutaminase-like cysteine proteinase